MSSTTSLALVGLALASALTLSACGEDDAAAGAGAASTGHGSDHGSASAGESKQGNDADVAFLTGMIPHHDQAVEMSQIVLAASPPAEVAAIARQIKDAQAPEIEQMQAMLDALGAKNSAGGHGGHGGGHGAAHGGMMTDAQLAELKGATGDDAARLYLEAMIAHHEGAITASRAVVSDGSYGPAIELAKQIERAQAAEIATMKRLLASL